MVPLGSCFPVRYFAGDEDEVRRCLSEVWHVTGTSYHLPSCPVLELSLKKQPFWALTVTPVLFRLPLGSSLPVKTLPDVGGLVLGHPCVVLSVSESGELGPLFASRPSVRTPCLKVPGEHSGQLCPQQVRLSSPAWDNRLRRAR